MSSGAIEVELKRCGMRKWMVVTTMMMLANAVVGAGDVFLVKNGKPQATIVVPAVPDNTGVGRWNTEDAGKFLQDYIRRATGAVLPVKKEGGQENKEFKIYLGRTHAAASAGIDCGKLPPEGYVVKSVPDGIVIAGKWENGIDQGTLFGIYRFLEDFAGVRWYFSGEMGTVIQKRDTLTIPGNLNLSGHPFFPVRIGGISHWRVEDQRDWHPVLRFGQSRGMIANHTEEGWHRLYGKTHPEYFGVRPDGSRAITSRNTSSGQNQSYICYSEPGVLKQHLLNIDNYMKTGDKTPWTGGAAPSGNNIPYGPNDVRAICQCPQCLAMQTPERGKYGRGSDLVFSFVEKLAKELKKSHPEVVLWVPAYDYYSRPPEKIKRLPDNVGITLCLFPTWIQTSHPETQKELNELTERWFELVGRNPERLVVWDYFFYPNCFFTAPTEIPHLLQKNINFLRGRSIGMMNNGFSPRAPQNPQLYLTYRIVWLYQQLLWNPDFDVEKARTQWCRDLFGPAAATMEKFYALLEERWEKTVWTTRPLVAYVNEYSVYAETYPPEVIAHLESLYETALKETQPDSIYRKRLDFFKEKAFAPFFAVAHDYQNSLGAVSLCRVADRRDTSVTPAIMKLFNYMGKPVDEETHVTVSSDEGNLYISAEMSLVRSGKEKDKGGAKEKQAEFQLGVGGGNKGGDSVKPTALASGRDNPAVENDDLFLVYLSPHGSDGYTELAVNPNGGFVANSDIIRKRGFFPSHSMLKMDTSKIAVESSSDAAGWRLKITIPWKSLPGLKTIPPEEIQAQFLRWNAREKYRFSCWSPTLTSWDFPLSRFGRLILKEKKMTRNTSIPSADQCGYMTCIGDKPEQPRKIVGGQTGKFILTGCRDLSQTKWTESRGILIFPLPEIKNKELIRHAFLEVTLVNAIDSEPFGAVAVDHIVPSNPARVQAEDYSSAPVGGRPVGVLLPAGFKCGLRMVKRKISLDVTGCVMADLAKQKVTAFRLFPPEGCTQKDGKNHSLVFAGVGPDSPKLVIEEETPK